MGDRNHKSRIASTVPGMYAYIRNENVGVVMSVDLNIWVQHINERHIPILNTTIQSVIRLTRDENSSSKQLADIILHDAALTTRVVRIANSPYFNRSHNQISDIRRALLLIGFDRVCEICLTVSIVDTLVKKGTRFHLIELLTSSYHAAIQARTLAHYLDLSDSDDIFISTLLNRIGEISFWSLTGRAGEDIWNTLNHYTFMSPEKAQRHLLGVSFRELTMQLVKEWSLSDLLKKSLLNQKASDKNIQCIRYGYQIAEQVQLDDNLTEQCKTIFSIFDGELKISDELLAELIENANHANELSRLYFD